MADAADRAGHALGGVAGAGRQRAPERHDAVRDPDVEVSAVDLLARGEHLGHALGQLGVGVALLRPGPSAVVHGSGG